MITDTAPDVATSRASEHLSPGASGNFSSGVVEVKVERAADVDEALHDAITLVLEPAMERRTGIMVTRIDAGRYTVQVHPEVPAGIIRQRYI